jgi:hypothetical protein
VFIKYDGEKLEFNFSKFSDKHLEKENFAKDKVGTLAYVVVASSNVMERYILNQDEPFTDGEK